MEIRKEVQWFAEQMELILQKNDFKGGWRHLPIWQLQDRLTEEKRELNKAIKLDRTFEDIINEAVDVANFAMFIADNFRRRRET